MADESAELVGGIEVSVGATHAKLISDLEAANRLLDQWSKQTFNVRVGAGVAAPAAQPARDVAPVRPATPPPIRYGAAATTGAQAGQGQTALQRAINAELAKTGEIWDATNNDVVSATRSVRQQREAVSQLQQTAGQGVGLTLDPDFQPQLEASLRTLREIVAEATKLASIGAAVDVPTLPPPEPVRPATRARSVTGARSATQGPRPATTPVAPGAPPVARPQAVAAIQQPPAVTEVRTQEAAPPARARRVAREEARAVAPLRTEEAAATPVTEEEQVVAAPVSRRRRPAPARVDEEPEGEYGPPIQYIKAKGPGYGGFRPVASPQQRAAEREARERARADEETVRQNAQQAADAERTAREAFLTAPPPHGYDEAPGSTTFAPQRRAEEQLRSADQNGRGFTTPPGHGTGGATNPISNQFRAPVQSRQEAADRQRAEEAERLRNIPEAEPYRLPNERPGARGAGADAEARAKQSFQQRAEQAEFRRVTQQAEIERRIDQARATQQAQIVAAGRTARTQASSLGGFFGGPRREQIEAQTELAAAVRETGSANRYLSVFENEMIRNRVRAETATRAEARSLHQRNEEIEASPEYQRALEGQTRAIERESTATQRLEKLSSGFGTAARSLVAVTAAGAAFGLGLKAIDITIAAIVPSLQNWVDIQTGFGATSTRVTSSLAAQTLQLHGNADAALAAAEAQAGLSASAADTLDQQLKLTTQIKAGALAQQQASELFRAGSGQGNAPTGLFGGFGGIGGTALLAQQMGGGRGFTETVAQDIGAFRKPESTQKDLLGDFNRGLSFVLSQDVRNAVTDASEQANSPIGKVLAPSYENAVRGMPFLGPVAQGLGIVPALGQESHKFQTEGAQKPTESETAYINNLNSAAARGAMALGSAEKATIAKAKSDEEVRAATAAAAAAGDVYGVTLAQQYGLVLRLNDAVATTSETYRRAAEQLAVGTGVPDVAVLGRERLAAEHQRQRESAASVDALKSQFEFERPATLNRLQREQDFQIGTQIPAQAALANLAAPPTPVGTGITGRNTAEQARINAGLKEAGDLQTQLNGYYAQGFNILRDTYQVPVGLLTQIQSIGSEIASTQAGIANSQSKYQVAQINFQLQIARRTLSDINGLTGKSFGGQGQSYLGQLERENLALGRQGQLLQFALSQRQLNFQNAVAGFQVPGLTPAEQNARVEEARIETSYAQKQLDIQKEMFGNQVQIVDIGNLRQGADLARQIGLLLQGRELSIDTAVAQQKLARLQAQQQILVQEAGTYITKVNAQVAGAMSEMESLEKATGRSISRTERQGIAAAYNVGRAFFLGISGGFLGPGGGEPDAGGTKGQGPGPKKLAAGGAFNTLSATKIGDNTIMGEAGGETLLVLSHPRSAGGSGGGGGGNVYVTFGDVQIRTEADFQRLYRMVLDALGRDAATKGLRTPF